MRAFLLSILLMSPVALGNSIAKMPKVQEHAGKAVVGSVERLPFTHIATSKRSGYYFIPPGNGPMPVLILFHGFKDYGESWAKAFKPYAERHKIVLLAPDSKEEKWLIPKKGEYTSDTQHTRDALAWLSARVKVDSAHVGTFGHSYGARMSSSYGTNMKPVTKTAISHGRFIPQALGGHRTKFWMSGSPKDNMFKYSEMPGLEKYYNSSYRKYWGGATLHTYDCQDCFHYPSQKEFDEFVAWFLL